MGFLMIVQIQRACFGTIRIWFGSLQGPSLPPKGINPKLVLGVCSTHASHLATWGLLGGVCNFSNYAAKGKSGVLATAAAALPLLIKIHLYA